MKNIFDDINNGSSKNTNEVSTQDQNQTTKMASIANKIAGVYKGIKSATNFISNEMDKYEDIKIAENEKAKEAGTQSTLQKVSDWIWNAAEKGSQIVGTSLKEKKQNKLDEDFNTYIDTDAVLQKVNDDETYSSKLVDDQGSLIDYTSQIESLQNEINNTSDSTTKKTLEAQLETIKSYQSDQNTLKYKTYYDQLKNSGASEDEINQFKNYVVSQDDTAIERIGSTLLGTLEGAAGSLLSAADAVYGKVSRILGYDYDVNDPDSLGSVLQDNAATLLQNAQQNAAGVEKDIYEIYSGIAPFLYDTAIAYATVGASTAEMAANPKLAAQLADRALLLSDVSVFGSNIKDKMDEGYDFNQAFLNSTYHAVLNHASETIFGNNVELVMDTVSGKLFQDLTDNFLLYSALTLGKSYAGEALEEGFEAVMEPVLDDISLNTGLTLSQYLDKEFWDDVGYQMRVGGLGGLVMGGVAGVSATITSKSDYNTVVQFRNELQELLNSDEAFSAQERVYLQNLINDKNKQIADYVEKNPYTNAFVSKSEKATIKQTAAEAKAASLAASQVDLTEKLTPVVELQQQMLSDENKLSDALQQKLQKEGVNVSTTDYVKLSPEAKIDSSLTAKYAKKLGKEVVFADIVDKNGEIIDGIYAGDTTIINPNAKLGALSTLLHEYTHGTESKKYYGKLAKSVKEFFGKGYDDAIQRIKDNYSTVTTLDDAGAEKELVAITTQSLLDNYEFVNSLVRYNNDLAYKLFTDIKSLVTFTGKAENIEQNFRKVFAEVDAENSTNDIDYSYVKNADIMADQKAWFENVGNKKSWNRVGSRFVTAEELEVAQKAMEIMAKQFEENSDLLPKENTAILGTKEGKTLLKDSSYGLSVENSTKCPRTLAYDELTNLVSEEVGRPLTAVESFLVSQKLYQIAVDPQCLYCYVALDRKSYNEFVGRYIEQRDAAIAAYEAAGKPTLRNYKNAETAAENNKLFREFLDGRKVTDNMWQRYKSWIDAYNNGTKLITKEDVATDNRRLDIENAGGDQWEQLSDCLAYAQSASWAKKAYEYRAYFDEIRKLSQQQINNLNKHYGLRWYSFNDYTPAYILENMQQFTDAALKGLKGLAYTKDTDFARIFAPTGCNINISVFVRQNADGTFEVDPVQSADLQEAIELRNQHVNVGIVATATSVEGVRWALQQDWTDVVIPFHIVRTGSDIAEYYKWTVFNQEQNDTVIDKNKWDQYVKNLNKPEKKVSKMIYPSEHQNDLKTYLKLCDQRGLKPRFSSFLNEGDNYMKLVNETRQSDQNTPYLKPYFDMEAAQYSFDKFKEKGGFYGGWYKDGVNLQKESNDVANDILEIEQGLKKYEDIKYGEGYVDFPEYLRMKKDRFKVAKFHGKGDLKYSKGITMSDLTNYNTAVKDGDMDVASKIVAKVAVEKGFNQEAWHGTNAYGFRVFRTSATENGKNIGSHFGTKNAAEGFANGDYGSMGEGDSKGVYHVYLKVNNPYETFDLFAQENSYIALQTWQLADELEKSGKDVEKAQQVKKYLNSKYGIPTEIDADEDIWDYAEDINDNANDKLTEEEIPAHPPVYYGGEYYDLNNWTDNTLYNSLVEMAKANGYDSFSYQNDLEDNGEIDYVVFDPEQIKSADPVTYDEDGNMIPLEERFDLDKKDIYYSKGISLKDVQDYRDAYENYDDETAQLIVDRVARNYGYNYKAYHHTENDFTRFNLDKARTSMDYQGFFFSADPEAESEYGSKRYDVYLKMENPYVIDSAEKMRAVPFDMSQNNSGVTAREWLQQNGYDSVIRDKDFFGSAADEYIVFDPSQIKSADPYTYDDDGDLIPIDARFNDYEDDIRFSNGMSLGDIIDNKEYYDYYNLIGNEEAANNIKPVMISIKNYKNTNINYAISDAIKLADAVDYASVYDTVGGGKGFTVRTADGDIISCTKKGLSHNKTNESKQYKNDDLKMAVTSYAPMLIKNSIKLNEFFDENRGTEGNAYYALFNDSDGNEYIVRFVVDKTNDLVEVDTDLSLHSAYADNLNKKRIMGGVTSQSEFTAENSTHPINNIDKLIRKVNQSIFKDELSMDVLENVNYKGYKRTNKNALKVKYSKGITLDAISNYNKAVQEFDTETAQKIVDDVANEKFANAKVRNKNGRLRKFYHGTNSGPFNKIDLSLIGSSSGDNGFFGEGFYGAFTESEASYYGNRVFSFYANIENPFNYQELKYNGEHSNAWKKISDLTKFANMFPNLVNEYESGDGGVRYIYKESDSDEIHEMSINDLSRMYEKAYDNLEYKVQEDIDSNGDKTYLVLANEKTITYTDSEGKEHSFKDYGYQEKYYGTMPTKAEIIDNYLKDQFDYLSIPTTRDLIMGTKFTDELKKMGYDGVIQSEDGDEIVLFYPNQIKLADAITYDDQGNVIPLEERFNESNDDIRYSKGFDLFEDNKWVKNAQEFVNKVNQNPAVNDLTIENLDDILHQRKVSEKVFEKIENVKQTFIDEADKWIKGYDTLRAEYPMFSKDTFNNALYEINMYGEIGDNTYNALANTLSSDYEYEGIKGNIKQDIDDFIKESLETFNNEVKYKAGQYDKAPLKKSMTINKAYESQDIEGTYNEAKTGAALDQMSASIKKDLQAYWQPVVDQLYNADVSLRETKGKRSDHKVSNWKTIDQNIFEIANGNSDLYNSLKQQIRYEMLDTAAATKNEVLKNAQTDVIDKVKKLGITEGSKEDIALQYYMEGHTEKKRTDININDKNITQETKDEYKKNPYQKYTLDDLKEEFPEKWEKIVEAAQIMRDGYDKTYNDIVESQTEANGDIEGKAEEEIAEKLAELNKAKLAMDNILAEIKKNGSKVSTQSAFEIAKRKYNAILKEYNTLIDKQSSNDLTRRNLTPYRENYVHHIVRNTLKDDFKSIVNAESNIPTELAGLSDFTNPNTVWSSFSMAQEGGRYTPTALGSYAAYMQEAANVLAYNPVILSIRQLNKDIKATAKNNELTRFSEYLNDYANMLAGKRDSIDRGVQKLIGPQGMQLIRKLNSYAKAAALTGNIKSGLTQFANIPNGLSILESKGGKEFKSDVAKGMLDWIKTWNSDAKSAIDQSSFLNNRYFGFETGKTGFANKLKNATDWMMTVGDKIGAETIWWSAYEQGVRLQNETNIDPILYADDVTRSAIAGRTKEDMALAMQSQTLNLLLPFQVENNNLFQTLKQFGSSKQLGAIATYNVAAFIFNMIMKALIGNDDEVLPDVITPFVKELKKLSNGKQDVSETSTNILAGEVAEFVSLLPYGSTAIQLMFGNDSESIFGDYDPNRYGATNIGLSGLGNVIKDMKTHEDDPTQQLIDIFDNLFEGYVKGGKQIMRTTEGLQSMGALPDYKGGEVQVSPVNYTSSGKNISYVNDQSNVLDWIRSALFGKWNTSAAQDYINNDFDYLSKTEQTVYDTLEASASDPYENYEIAKDSDSLRTQLINSGKYEDYIQTIKDAYADYEEVWNSTTHSDSESKKTFTQFANGYGISSDDLKQDTYDDFYKTYEVGSDTQAKVAEALEIENDKDENGKTVANSAAKQRKAIYEELGIYEQILEYIENNDLEYSDFGLTKTVVESGNSSSKGSKTTNTSSTQKKAIKAYISSLKSANDNIFSNIKNMTSISDAKSNVEKIMKNAYKG